MPRHKHADLIHAWADGAEIQFKDGQDNWIDCFAPSWADEGEYRIKPKVIKYQRYLRKMRNDGLVGVFCMNSWDTVDPELTGGFIRWIDLDWQEIEEI